MATDDKGRRRFLSYLTQAGATLLGLCMAIPALAYVSSPLRRKGGAGALGGAFADVGAFVDLPLGKWQLVTLEVLREDGWEKTRTRRSVYVRRSADGAERATVLSPICPHLGCPIAWQPDQSEFKCPCHQGTFSGSGERVSGPPPRGMDALDFEVRGGRLLVRWQDFKIGVPQRVPVDL
jgi:menaquinol-cytochrome c reductase iron-sulfur subunit